MLYTRGVGGEEAYAQSDKFSLYSFATPKAAPGSQLRLTTPAAGVVKMGHQPWAPNGFHQIAASHLRLPPAGGVVK